MALNTALIFAQESIREAGAKQTDVDYVRDVRPILRTKCSMCHNSVETEGGLRLDSATGALAGGDSGPVIVPGHSGESLLIQAVLQTDDLKMPPPDEGKPLEESQIEILRRWIDQGAVIPEHESQVSHWAFQKPVRPVVPKPQSTGEEGEDLSPGDADRINPIDAFLDQQLQLFNLQPLPAAPRHVQLRRVYLDLLGIPPTPEQLQSFLDDDSPQAWEKVVDELLASPHYGERWGRHWMDVWRYSDWDGHGAEVRESKPHIWRWRDWIIESLNQDKPYDQMIVEMLAGDEVAPLDPDTLRATGFLARNWYLFNRNTWLDNTLEHTGKAFLGVTFNCARCHDHMYDPISQVEYYQLRAFFEAHDVRTDRLPGQSDVTKDGLVRVYDAHAETPTHLFVRGDEKNPLADQPMLARIPTVFGQNNLVIQSVELPAAAYYPGLLDHVAAETLAAVEAEKLATSQVLASARQDAAKANADLIAFQQPVDTPPTNQPVLRDDFADANPEIWEPGTGDWQYQNGHLEQRDAADTICKSITRQPHPSDFTAKLKFRITGGDVYKSVGIAFDLADDQNFSYVYASAGGAKVQIAHRIQGVDQYPQAGARDMTIELDRDHELMIAVRGSDVEVILNGKRIMNYPLPFTRPEQGRLSIWTYDAQASFLALEVTRGAVLGEQSLQEIANSAAAALVLAEKKHRLAQSAVERVRTCIAADQAVYSQPPSDQSAHLASIAARAERVQAVCQAELNLLVVEQALAKVKTKMPVEASTATPAQVKAIEDGVAAVAAANTALDAARLALAEPSEQYTRLTTVYPPTSTGRRLALARWITSPNNPLTARVAINHLWLRHFHQPLVPNVFDFGMNGKPPLHPELLDWLACEFMDQGWKMKTLHRLILTSDAYRRSSSPAPDQREVAARNQIVDRENVHLWRQNSYRMEAEVVRDSTLFLAGNLDTSMYGPDLDPNAGQTNGRRSIYFRNSKEKKMSFLAAFDGPNPVECYQRAESVSPQQSLALSNSPLAIVQARAVAQELSLQLESELPENAAQKFVVVAFLKVLNREPNTAEIIECLDFLQQQTEQFAAGSSLTAFPGGETVSTQPSTDPAQRARENLVHVLFNHNDFVTVR